MARIVDFGSIGTDCSQGVGHLVDKGFCEVHERTGRGVDSVSKWELPRGYDAEDRKDVAGARERGKITLVDFECAKPSSPRVDDVVDLLGTRPRHIARYMRGVRWEELHVHRQFSIGRHGDGPRPSLTAHTRANQALELVPALDGRNQRTRLRVERAWHSCSLRIKFSLKSWSSHLTLIPALKWKREDGGVCARDS